MKTVLLDGKLYEGGFVSDMENNPVPNGRGKLYRQNGTIEYSGVFKDGYMHGYGVLYKENGSRYEGEFRNGYRHGQGKQYDRSGCLEYGGLFNWGCRFEGEWLDENGAGGTGVEYWPTGSPWYDGEFKEGLRHGHGKLYRLDGKLEYVGLFNRGFRYQGEWKEGAGAHGKGNLSYDSGELWYEGEWRDGQRCGRGNLWFEEGGLEYGGEWFRDKRHGRGREHYSDGKLRYDGDWQEDRRHGHGKLWYHSGALCYDGNWFQDRFHGKGTKFDWWTGEVEHKGWFNHGFIYEGEWEEGIGPNGRGKEYDPIHRKLLYEGEFKNGERWLKKNISQLPTA